MQGSCETPAKLGGFGPLNGSDLKEPLLDTDTERTRPAGLSDIFTKVVGKCVDLNRILGPICNTYVNDNASSVDLESYETDSGNSGSNDLDRIGNLSDVIAEIQDLQLRQDIKSSKGLPSSEEISDYSKERIDVT